MAAILANCLSVLAIAEWRAHQDSALLVALGCPDGKTPYQSTLQRLFAKLGGKSLAAALLTCFAPLAQPGRDARQGIAIDGKAQGGRLRFPGHVCPVHAFSAYCHDLGLVLAQDEITAPTESDKGAAELTAAIIRHHSRHPDRAVALVLSPLATRA